MILGMKVRKQDMGDILKFEPKILEFHFSDSDLNLTLEKNYSQQLIVHCYEYFDRKLLDITNLKETNQIHSQEKSLELIQKAIEKTLSLNSHFVDTPSIVVHPGGYSLTEPSEEEKQRMQDGISDAIKKLDITGVNFLLENMPPYAWFFGGRWNCSAFLSTDEMINYCKKTGLRVCYDLCHSQLFCNVKGMNLVDEIKNIEYFVDHFHLSDADGIDGEGLQYGEGTMNFKEIIPILNKHVEKSFAIEVWKGHENGGIGFKKFLDEIVENGLVIN